MGIFDTQATTPQDMAEIFEIGIEVTHFFCVIHVKTESCTVQAGPALKQHFLAKREATFAENEIRS